LHRQRVHKERLLPHVRRVVIKIGSSILSTTSGIDRPRMRRLVNEIHALVARGYEVVLVSSGAVAAGLSRLGLRERPRTIPQKQAAAAVGQIGLMALYQEYFAAHGRHVGQILLTHDDLAHRRRYLNARHTFDELIAARIVPVVNENDSVVVDEMMADFGDNDNLSALVATLVDADLLVILSDVAGLYTANPHTHPEAELVPLVGRIDAGITDSVTDSTSPVGTGGMATKVRAAHTVTEAGIPCVVADGLHSGVLAAVFDPAKSAGTLFLPSGDRLNKRKHWIAHALEPAGTLIVDQGAYEAVRKKGGSLLPRGLTAIKGDFGVGECVSCINPDGEEFARGLVNYSSADLVKIKGLHTTDLEAALGYKISDEIIHRDDLVLLILT
jgi:glutamate 5-kinase